MYGFRLRLLIPQTVPPTLTVLGQVLMSAEKLKQWEWLESDWALFFRALSLGLGFRIGGSNGKMKNERGTAAI